MNYRNKLRDPRWQKRRLEILERDQWRCTVCGEDTQPLHVHHLYYDRFTEPWDAKPRCLITMCAACHSEEESSKEPIASGLYAALRVSGVPMQEIECLFLSLWEGSDAALAWSRVYRFIDWGENAKG